MNKPRLCYVLPKYDENDPSHFSYLPDFLRAIAEFFDIFLIIERGKKPADNFGCSKVKVLKFSFLPLKIFELRLTIFLARRRGYRDFYIHYSFLAAFLASLAAKVFGGRVFYWNCGEPWKYRRNFFREIFERNTYRLIDFLVTGTDSLAEKYSNHYGIPRQKIKVMPNWIELNKIKNQSPIKCGTKTKNELREILNIAQGTKIILFVHRLSRRKGAHLLPEILNKLSNKNVVMVIIGDGPKRQNLEVKFKEYQLTGKVRFLGWVANKDILDYYELADVFLMPSQEEGFPHVILEAMASGLPFVASNVGAVKEIIPFETQNYLAEPDQPEQFAFKINELLGKSPAWRNRMRSVLTNWVERYDMPGAIDKFIKILQ